MFLVSYFYIFLMVNVFFLILLIFLFFHLANTLHNGDVAPTYNHGRSRSGAEDHSEPPRPPPPRPEGNKTIQKKIAVLIFIENINTSKVSNIYLYSYMFYRLL